LLAIVAAVLCGDLIAMLVPRLRSDHVPRWARRAPRLRVAVANVFVDNPTPRDAARQLVRCGADVIVIAEATPEFIRLFDAAGGKSRYPHRVLDPDDHSDYAVAVVSRRPLQDGSRMEQLGQLNLAIARVAVGATTTTVVGLNPRATFDPDGHETWKEQIAALEQFVPTVSGPLLVAGDLNGTRFRPEFDELLDHGLSDCLDAVGQAWTPSFSLRSVRLLGALGNIARLDHALGNDGVHALRAHNMEACGSDHLPFLLTVAVRTAPPDGAERPLSSAAA
jgi:endonuclease/exonuclease/phosphatase (EEP) superfamily protein YafD